MPSFCCLQADSQMKGKTMWVFSASSPGYSLRFKVHALLRLLGLSMPPQLPPPLWRCYCSHYLHTDLLRELKLKLSVQMNQNHKDLLPNATLAYGGLMGWANGHTSSCARGLNRPYPPARGVDGDNTPVAGNRAEIEKGRRGCTGRLLVWSVLILSKVVTRNRGCKEDTVVTHCSISSLLSPLHSAGQKPIFLLIHMEGQVPRWAQNPAWHRASWPGWEVLKLHHHELHGMCGGERGRRRGAKGGGEAFLNLESNNAA